MTDKNKELIDSRELEPGERKDRLYQHLISTCTVPVGFVALARAEVTLGRLTGPLRSNYFLTYPSRSFFIYLFFSSSSSS